MKKTIAVLLMLAFTLTAFAACTPPIDVSPDPGASASPAVTSPGITIPDTVTPGGLASEGKTPDGIRLDGSTGNIPMAIGILQRYYDMSDAEAEETVQFHKTAQSYIELVDGRSDMILVTIPDADTDQYIKESGVELETFPLKLEGLCFIVNENNPVSNLTTQQLQDIYQGKITNWKDVGGNDQEIIAFQRNENSGSQALMRDLVMKNLTMMTAPAEWTPGEMGDLVESLAEYNNEGGALGYSTYYFASVMYSKPGLKFISVDGIAPDKTTIGSADYPFTSESSIVIRKDEPADSPVRKLAAWICSSEGDALLTELGYVPAVRS